MISWRSRLPHSILSEALAKVKSELLEQASASIMPVAPESIESLFMKQAVSEVEEVGEAAAQSALLREKAGFVEGIPIHIAVFSWDKSLSTQQQSNLKVQVEEMWQEVSVCTVFRTESRGMYGMRCTSSR